VSRLQQPHSDPPSRFGALSRRLGANHAWRATRNYWWGHIWNCVIRWLHPEPFIPYGTEAKARDYFALAAACFERLESASDPAACSGLKQMAHRSLEEAMKLLNEQFSHRN
jgi:hypothetical protein